MKPTVSSNPANMSTSRDDSPFQYKTNATHVNKPIIKIITYEFLSNTNVAGGGLTLDDKPSLSGDTLGTSETSRTNKQSTKFRKTALRW